MSGLKVFPILSAFVPVTTFPASAVSSFSNLAIMASASSFSFSSLAIRSRASFNSFAFFPFSTSISDRSSSVTTLSAVFPSFSKSARSFLNSSTNFFPYLSSSLVSCSLLIEDFPSLSLAKAEIPKYPNTAATTFSNIIMHFLN